MEITQDPGSISAAELDRVIEQYHLALGDFVKGNPDPMKLLFSHRDDVTLANPLGPPGLGWKQVSGIMDRAAADLRDGELSGVDNIVKYVTPSLAFIVEMERETAKVAGRQDITPVPLRTTTIFRPEDGTWKVMHRHADSVTSPRPPASMIQK